MSQSESDRRAEEAKARAKAEAALRDRELSDTELESIAAAGDDPIKGGSNDSGTSPFKKG